MHAVFRMRGWIQLFVYTGCIMAFMLTGLSWAKINPGQWQAAWEESNGDLEGSVKDNKLLKKIKKTASSSKISGTLQKLDSLDGKYIEAQSKYLMSKNSKNLKNWKKVLGQFKKEMQRFAKSKDKYLGNMKAILKKAKPGRELETINDKFKLHRKNLKAIDSGVQYIYSKNAAFLENNITDPKNSKETLSRQAAIKIKTMKSGLKNGYADLGKSMAKVQSKPSLKIYKKYLFEDIRTLRGLLGDCHKLEEIPDPPKGLHKAFVKFEGNIKAEKLKKEADNLVKKFKQKQAKAEEMVVLREIAELAKARKGLKGYLKKLEKIKL